MRIIVVGQDTATLDKVEIYLLSIGCEDLHFTLSPQDALKFMKKNRNRPFDCMLLDLDVADAATDTCIDRVRRLEGYEDLPVLLLSAQPRHQRTAMAHAMGASGCLAKPVAPLDLLTWLKKTLNARCEGGWLVPLRTPRRTDGRSRPILVGAYKQKKRSARTKFLLPTARAKSTRLE